jgi:acyl-CoA synthetase (AMP-forming)/AMP-acid ligase II
MNTLRELIRESCASHSDSVAFIDAESGDDLTFAEFEALTNRVAHALSGQGVALGQPVALLMENCLDWPVVEVGLAKIGAVCIPLNYRLSPRELGWQLNHCGATVLVADATLLSVGQDATRLAGGRVTVLAAADVTGPLADGHSEEFPFTDDLDGSTPQRIAYTSATTGAPKGVRCPNQHIYDNALTIRACQLSDMRPDDRYLVATPLTHMAIGYLWPVFLVGATSVITQRYRPREFCDQVAEYRITHTLLAPTMIVTLLSELRQDGDLLQQLRAGTLRRVWYAGSGMPVAVAEEGDAMLGPILGQQFGFTELWSAAKSMCCTFLPPGEHAAKRGSCGRAMTGLDVRVVDEHGRPVPPGTVGEIVVRAEEPIGGYLGDPAQTEETFGGGWIRPGDVGRFDEDGYLYITDRIKDMIISGGFNIYSAEVESVIFEHPAVLECAVVGIPDETWGEVPSAHVVLRAGAEPPTEQELVDWVRARLAHYKAPKRVRFEQSLPKSELGKILKREIRRTAAAQL